MSLPSWVLRREQGLVPYYGEMDNIMGRLYGGIKPRQTWPNYPNQDDPSEYGAVFNLEFSIEGNIVAAACERKTILIFDAVTYQQTHVISKAHTDNVNCVKFLDNRTFATCSDDTTVAIWDIRFLKRRLKNLQGHSNWVKNIEYSKKENLLVTSGFDGSIFLWDINSNTENGLIYQKAFNTPGLMRCRLSPDSSKLVFSTTGGYMMIVHDLNLANLSKDLRGFRPSIYRLMQMGAQYIPSAAHFDYLFSKRQKRNRIELVTDFPDGNDAEIILALQMHPSGLSVLSRNISYDEMSEWSCVHDISEENYDLTELRRDRRKRKLPDENESNPCDSARRVGNRNNRRIRRRLSPRDGPSTSAGLQPSRVGRNPNRNIRPRSVARSNQNADEAQNTPPEPEIMRDDNQPTTSNHVFTSPIRTSFIPDIWAAEITVQERQNRQARGGPSNSIAGYDIVYAVSSGLLSSRLPINPNNLDADEPPPAGSPQRLISREKKFILQNAKKLMYYASEVNTDKGFIKEPDFSSDGRIICSPYNTGIRLLSYNEECSLLPQYGAKDCLKVKPKQLQTIKIIDCHKEVVLCTAFSPRQPLLVSGCRAGKIVWHTPQL